MIKRQENDSLPLAEQLPQRALGSRMLMGGGARPMDAAFCVAARVSAPSASPRSHP